MLTCLLPNRPPEMLSVALPVGEGVPEPFTVRLRLPRQLGKAKPARMPRKSAHASLQSILVTQNGDAEQWVPKGPLGQAQVAQALGKGKDCTPKGSAYAISWKSRPGSPVGQGKAFMPGTLTPQFCSVHVPQCAHVCLPCEEPLKSALSRHSAPCLRPSTPHSSCFWPCTRCSVNSFGR